MQQKPHVVIIGGGFGGLYAAKALKNLPIEVTLIDRRNFHLFQPLLYQVAMAGLSPGNIAASLRSILGSYKNISVLMGEVSGIDAQQKQITLGDGKTLDFDALIVAAGASHSYFGNPQWADHAPGLKTLEDALDIRRRVLTAYERAELESDPEKRQALLTFAVVGAGPTGVELAGALGEMAHYTLKGEFRTIDPTEAQILLIEASDRVLPPYPAELSASAQKQLTKLGVTVYTNTLVTDIQENAVTVKQTGQDAKPAEQTIGCHTVIWAAGVQASPLGQTLHDSTGVPLDRAGRVQVAEDLSIPGFPHIFVIGDLAHFSHQSDRALPGIAPVAMQQGKYVASLLQKRYASPESSSPATKPHPFHYVDRGSMATIGRAAAVAQIRGLRFSGLLAWLAWLLIHLLFLAEFSNRLLVFVQWMWNYFTYKRGVRLIVGDGHKQNTQDSEGRYTGL